MTRKRWITGLLAATGLVLGAEVWASWDDSAATVPWTELIVTYVPAEVTAAAIGTLMAWVPLHFGLRYWRRSHGGWPRRRG